MPKTRAQKSNIITKGIEELKDSTNLIFADFSGTTAQDLRDLRLLLKNVGAKFQVIKKRLLRLILKEKGIDFDPKQFEAQVGTVFVKGEIYETVGSMYRFTKDKERFKILGGFDLNKAEKIEADFIKRIGQLPSREVLLGQLVRAIAAPIRMLMYVLQERSKKVG